MGQSRLGELELLVLLAAMRLGDDEAYAVSIVDEIGEQAGRRVKRATVYVVLQRLAEKGFVSTRLGPPQPRRGGKPRRLVRVEPAGVAAAREVRKTLRSMWGGLAVLEDGS